MKLKRTNKLLALLLAVLMVMSLLPVTALAAKDNRTIIIDLTNYSGKITGGFSSNFTNDKGGALLTKQINTFSFGELNSGSLTIDFTLSDFESASYNSWAISGSMGNGTDIDSYISDDSDNQKLIFYRFAKGSEQSVVEQIVLQGNHFTRQSFHLEVS